MALVTDVRAGGDFDQLFGSLDSIKSIDWVLFAPHGIRSYFAKPFYTEQGLHAILILASVRPGSFGADAETRFASLMGPFERLIGAWRKG